MVTERLAKPRIEPDTWGKKSFKFLICIIYLKNFLVADEASEPIFHDCFDYSMFFVFPSSVFEKHIWRVER